ncbi:Asx homology domain-containing protein [Jackrogersella minutella]|nr:Asx homology domain-containing protein [Jackrogersella minutella]
MPPRKKNTDAITNKSLEATRRSTRSFQKSTPILGDTSEDELASNLSLQANLANSMEPESCQQDEVAGVIAVRTTRAKSYTSSRPSTAHSDNASQQRVIPTPVTTADMKKPDDAHDRGEDDELAGDGPALKKPKASLKDTPANARKNRSKYNNPDEMLTNHRAPLATTNLRDLLCSSKAWDALSPEEKQLVLSKFPDEKEVLDAGTENARPDVAALRNNDNFRHDVARYQGDLSKGWHDPDWIRQAQAAHSKREIGAYNEYLAAKFEEDWDMPIPGQEGSRSEHEVGDDGEKNEEMKEPEMEQAGEVQEHEAYQEKDAMEGVESTSKETEEERPGKEDPAKEDEAQENGQGYPLDTTTQYEEMQQ